MVSLLFELGLLGFAIVLFSTSLSNFLSFKKVSEYKNVKNLPFVSILVPARNEESNIKKCVESLIKQNYPRFELIVLDDNSTDNTLKVLKKQKKKHRELKIVKGKKLPLDWQGKNWACHQLSRKAKGDLLLFTDADTIHSTNSLRYSVNCLIREKVDVVSLFPKQVMESFGEKLFMPIAWWSLFSVHNHYLTRKNKWPFPVMIGQFMLFKKKVYESIGGHEAVKLQADDDISLASLLKKKNKSLILCNGTDVVKCRMYTGFWNAFNGFRRLLFPAFNYGLLFYLWVWIWLLFFLYIPLFNSTLLYTMTLTLTLFSIITTLNYLDFPIFYSLLYPLTYIILFFSAITSPIATSILGVDWKGRKLKINPLRFF